MRKYAAAIVSLCGSFIWWIGGQLYGDRIFAGIKPMIPEVVINPSIASIGSTLFVWGPILALLALGAYLVRRPEKAPKTESRSHSNITVSAGNGNIFGDIGHKVPSIPPLTGGTAHDRRETKIG